MRDRDVYRRVYLRLWRHPAFRAFSDGEKVLALYMVSGPQTNQIGCYYFSPALASEDLGVSSAGLAKRLRSVCDAFGWEWREETRLFYVPSWLTWNQPNSANARKAWHAEAMRVDDQMLRARLLHAIGTPSARHSDDERTQDQEQEQKQEEEPPNPPLARGARITRSERHRAEAIRRNSRTGCEHEPRCGTYDECIVNIALGLRERVSA